MCNVEDSMQGWPAKIRFKMCQRQNRSATRIEPSRDRILEGNVRPTSTHSIGSYAIIVYVMSKLYEKR